MAFTDILRLRRNLPRLARITFVLARYGFGRQVDKLGLRERGIGRILLFRRRATPKDLTPEQRLVKALQELGTTFIKLGQILSTRPDIVGETFAEEFKRLRDQVVPFDSAMARQIIETELKLPIGQVFSSFSDQPSGSGSIAQVHQATLRDGTEVMVKVRRPGIRHAILADMAILRGLAKLAEPRFPELRPTVIVEEFERAMRNELDFTVEAANTAWFHENLPNAGGVRAPAVCWKYTTSAVLTLQRLSGVPISDIAELDRRGYDRPLLARRLAECFMNQYFKTGLFHADPHSGNLIVTSDGTIGLIDFGMVGHLTPELKGLLTTILVAAVQGEIDFIGETAAEIGIIGDDFDLREFSTDLADLYHTYRGMPLGHIDIRRLFAELVRVARQNDLALPRDLVMLGKSVATLSSVTRILDPSYDVLRMAAPKTDEILKERLSPRRLAAHAGLNALSLLRLLRNIPRDIRSIMRKAEAGQFQIGFRHRGLERVVSELDRASNRLAISIYVAALLVASSLLIRYDLLAYRGVSIPGIMGYGLAGILSLWLAWGILRSGRL